RETPRALAAAADHALEFACLIVGQMAAAVVGQRLGGKQLHAIGHRRIVHQIAPPRRSEPLFTQRHRPRPLSRRKWRTGSARLDSDEYDTRAEYRVRLPRAVLRLLSFVVNLRLAVRNTLHAAKIWAFKEFDCERGCVSSLPWLRCD